MTAAVQHRELPYLDSHTAEFIDHPNGILGMGPDRIRVADGRSGVEVFSYETIRDLFRDDRVSPRTPQVFIDKGIESGPIMDYLVLGNLNLTWADVHDRLRPVMVRGFRASRIAQARGFIRELASDLIDGLLTRGSCNFVTDYSHHLSIQVISQFIGIPPEDVPEFEHATVELRLLGQEPFWPGVPRLESALAQVRDYSQKIVEKRKARPEKDFISDLVDAAQAGDRISEAEMVWNIAGVLLAGHDTTRYQLASCVRSVVDAGQWETLHAHPELVPAAVNEAMRLHPATPRQVKVALSDLIFEGQHLAAGDRITLNLAAAGRDPAAFTDPDRLDLHRPEPLFDMGFGYGAHYCLGFAIAKAEMEEALTLLTRRLTDVAIDGAVVLSPGGVIAGPEVVPLRYRRRA
ncbi:cytochrome P450 [Trebonia kvetii]|uniref:Cytochrome P450 n=1 Tax=Trebonia kvetii TaxID=2480626 RepID=A0A6P2BYF4_9ACTN|nr:cytochrome P450 [Trebonia kvetii]TVZ02223.1 cytochrome P450 [Trebonia kvetii]